MLDVTQLVFEGATLQTMKMIGSNAQQFQLQHSFNVTQRPSYDFVATVVQPKVILSPQHMSIRVSMHVFIHWLSVRISFHVCMNMSVYLSPCHPGHVCTPLQCAVHPSVAAPVYTQSTRLHASLYSDFHSCHPVFRVYTCMPTHVSVQVITAHAALHPPHVRVHAHTHVLIRR